MVRELEEETGYRVRVGDLLGIFSLWLDAAEAVSGTPGHVLGIVYEIVEYEGERTPHKLR